MKSCKCNNTGPYLFLKYGWVLILWGLGISCSNEVSKEYEVLPAFYYWKSSFRWTEQAEKLLTDLHTRTLYLKLFDVDWVDELQQAIPIAPLKGKHNIPENANIVPTIYITNKVFYHLNDTIEIDSLAWKVQKGIRNFIGEDTRKPYFTINQIQIDCDWSVKTKAAYFRFLAKMKEFVEQEQIETLSATIRLHQVKFPKETGIPPVDRGLLMFYNTGSVGEYQEKNAILDLETATQYTSYLPTYPLDLDLALPLFAWGVVFRKKKFQYLVNHLRMETLKEHPDFEKVKENIFSVTRNTYIKNTAFQKGDKVRVEEISVDLLQKSTQHLRQYWPNDSLSLAFYHLDSLTLQPYTHETLLQVCQNFATNTPISH